MKDNHTEAFQRSICEFTQADFCNSADNLADEIVRTPLLPFEAHGERRIRLKAENLQLLGSFKIRAATSVLSARGQSQWREGLATASAGNFAQGLALAAQRRGVTLTVHAPDSAAGVKAAVIEELGARIIWHSFADWFDYALSRGSAFPDEGLFIHPVCEPEVILGNGTIALELIEDWPEVDTVVVPVGGGGLAVGIALAFKALGRNVRIIACEIETSTPLAAARTAGRPVKVERKASFVDGIGSLCVLPEMWPCLRDLVDRVIVVNEEDAKAALRRLASQNHLIVEGAGAVALAAALSQECGGRNVAVILSGGNIDPIVLSGLLREDI